MEKKERNADGSKRRKPNPGDNDEIFQANWVWELMKVVGRMSSGFDTCGYCEVEVLVNPKKLYTHYNSDTHVHNQPIQGLLPQLAIHGISCLDGKKKFYCEENGPLEYKVKTLVEHMKDHGRVEKLVHGGGGEEDFRDHTSKVFKQKLWLVDLESTNVGLNFQLLSFNKVYPPMTLREDSPSNTFLANIQNGIFSDSELTTMTKIASYLEREGDYVNRLETIQGTKMSALEGESLRNVIGTMRPSPFGMRWGMGDTGWYRHKHADVHRLALELSDFIFDRLEKHYPCVFQHLRKILEFEGVANGEATLGKSPFTSVAVTRDYNVRPLIDVDDYDLGFILWLQEEYVDNEEEVSLFAFPEYRTSFTPRHGDVLCFWANSVYHWMRVLKKTQQLWFGVFPEGLIVPTFEEIIRSSTKWDY